MTTNKEYYQLDSHVYQLLYHKEKFMISKSEINYIRNLPIIFKGEIIDGVKIHANIKFGRYVKRGAYNNTYRVNILITKNVDKFYLIRLHFRNLEHYNVNYYYYYLCDQFSSVMFLLDDLDGTFREFARQIDKIKSDRKIEFYRIYNEFFTSNDKLLNCDKYEHIDIE